MSHLASSWAIKQVGISLPAKMVLMILADHHNSVDGGCYPALSTLAQLSCCDVKTARKAIDELEEKGLVRRETRVAEGGRQTSNQYHLMIPTDDGRVPNVVPTPLPDLVPLEPVRNNHSDTTYQADPILQISNQEPPREEKLPSSVLSLPRTVPEDDPPDENTVFWAEATALALAAGIPKKTAGAIIGKALKLSGGNRKDILQRLESAAEKGADDPVSWLMAGIGGRQKRAKEIKNAAVAAAFAKLEEEDARIKAEWAKRSPDDGGESSQGDHAVLQPEPSVRPRVVPDEGGRSPKKLLTRRASKVMRPINGSAIQSEVCADDSGVGAGSENHTESKNEEQELCITNLIPSFVTKTMMKTFTQSSKSEAGIDFEF